jgi:CxxC motif-containing protein (DUF1111 family)
MLDAFERGREVFLRRFTRSEGHGPDFNTSSCRSCHENPVPGGSSPLYRNFNLVGNLGPGGFVPAMDDGQFVARTFSYERKQRETIPPDADVVAPRNAPPMFGLGLLDTISVADIRANEDPGDILTPDGISGRINVDGTRLGRFGYKAQNANLEGFIRGPLFNHMGITSDPISPLLTGGDLIAIAQVGVPDESTTDDDGVPDPEISNADLSDLLVFTTSLAPPAPLPMDAEATRGEQLFTQINCAKCHIPNLVTNGPPIFAYTDLLIHDMGPGLADGVIQGSATGSEFRTQPLWGLRHTAPFLHDGRAPTILRAIEFHGGEALESRDAFAALSPADRAALIAFLETR